MPVLVKDKTRTARLRIYLWTVRATQGVSDGLASLRLQLSIRPLV
jgi:hypothetical protein